MIYMYDYLIGWFTPNCDRLTMQYVWVDINKDFYNDKIIYVGY